MNKSKTNLLTVFPGRKDSKIADVSELCTTSRVTRQNSGGSLFTTCEYTGRKIVYQTTSAPLKRTTYSPEPKGPKPKMAKQAAPVVRSIAKAAAKPRAASPVKTAIAISPPAEASPVRPTVTTPISSTPSFLTPAVSPTPILPTVDAPEVKISVDPAPAAVSSGDELASGDGLPGSFNLSGDEILDFDEAIFDNLETDESLQRAESPENKEEVERIRGMYSDKDALPVRFMGKLAIEYDNFDFQNVCEQITSLSCFNKLHEESLIPLLKLADRDVTSKLSTVNIKKFYKHELIPAMENLKIFKEEPEKFHDKHKGQFELYIEDNRIVEVPLPPRPQIFPHQLRNIDITSMIENLREEEEKRNQEEEQRQAEAQRVTYQHILATDERNRATLELLYRQYHRPQNVAPFINNFVYTDVNQNNINFPYFPNTTFPHPSQFYGSSYNPQMFP